MPNANYYESAARKRAKQYGIDPDLFANQIRAESNFDPNVTSSAGAQGIAQIIPSTAKSWGVNALDPEAALDAAARNMAQYSKKYGGYRNALVAYNAGPGAVGGSLPKETQDYIARIMGTTGHPQSPIPDARVDVSSRNDRSLGMPTDDRFDVLNRLIARTNASSAPSIGPQPMDTMQLVERLKRLREPSTSSPGNVESPSSPTPVGPASKGGKTIRELFYDPQGAWDEGVKIPAIGGHSDHVHVSTNTPAEAITLGTLAQKKFGLHVGEQSHFGEVHRVHAENSFHYKDQAIDVSGDPKQMDAFARYVRRKYGLK